MQARVNVCNHNDQSFSPCLRLCNFWKGQSLDIIHPLFSLAVLSSFSGEWFVVKPSWNISQMPCMPEGARVEHRHHQKRFTLVIWAMQSDFRADTDILVCHKASPECGTHLAQVTSGDLCTVQSKGRVDTGLCSMQGTVICFVLHTLKKRRSYRVTAICAGEGNVRTPQDPLLMTMVFQDFVPA